MAIPFGKYQLLRKIATGGMGQVFLAREHAEGLERLVVLKLLLPHLAEDEDFLGMFLEEARLVARLSHPHIIRILEVSRVNGRPCLAMEYVQGEDLRQVDRRARLRGRPLPLGLVLRIVSDVAAGLDHVHKATDSLGQPLRLVHRDVSPQNVLVGFDGGVKIIDFGVAKAAGSTQRTVSGVLKGKYPYMSPEQAQGLPVEARSDQFSLGIVLWELLTGRRLFKGETDLMTLHLVRECQVPLPSQLAKGLPPELDALVLRALAPRPEERYPDCGALRLALEELLLQHQLPSSSAHLSAWLQELYADRLTREADPARLDELTEHEQLHALMPLCEPRQGSTPARHSSASLEVPWETGCEPPVPQRQTLTLSPARSVGSLLLMALALCSLLAGAGLTLLLRPQAPLPPPPPQAGSQVPVPPEPQPQSPAQSPVPDTSPQDTSPPPAPAARPGRTQQNPGTLIKTKR